MSRVSQTTPVLPQGEDNAVRLCLSRLPAGLSRLEIRQAGRDWLRQTLVAITGQRIEAITRTANGKPQVAGLDWGFSYSNSRDLVALAVVPGAVRLGLDMEPLQPRPALLRLARRYFAPHEASALACLPESDRLRAFYALWTAREARSKCRGGRLWLSLKEPVLPDPVALPAGTSRDMRFRWLVEERLNLLLCLWIEPGSRNFPPVQVVSSAAPEAVDTEWIIWRWPK